MNWEKIFLVGVLFYLFITDLSAQVEENSFIAGGGIGWDIANSITVSDIAFITGSFQDTAIFGNMSVTCEGEQDIFVLSYDFLWGQIEWVVRAGGEGINSGQDIAMDGQGNIYITGYFSGTAEFGDITLNSIGEKDIFVAKLDYNGNWLWAQRAGGISNDYSNSIAIDSNDNILITGRFYETAYFGNIELISSGSADIFIAKLSSTGSWLWATNAGGEDYAESTAISISQNDEIYITGFFSGTIEFATKDNEVSLSSTGWADVFVAKLDSDGKWIWAIRAGSEQLDISHDIYSYSYDSGYDVIYITGEFRGTAHLGEDIIISGSSYLPNIFVAKIDGEGIWLWAQQSLGTAASIARSICSYQNVQQLVIVGNYWNDVQFGNFELHDSGSFIALINTDSGDWLHAQRIGNSSTLQGYSASSVPEHVDILILVTGIFSGSVQFGGQTYHSVGLTDIYIAGYFFLSNVLPVPTELLVYNYPNPFNPETTIIFRLPQATEVRLEIFNIKGQKIATLLNDYRGIGEHRIEWNGKDNQGTIQSSGVYLYRLLTAKESVFNKMVKVK
ncbi:MAG: T9SS type A sorting domain-containing protein [Candidatus Cloacimonetes bacterium]|nr:T9SS type A sorting domain-containing protein [Candidatus Cloacimonadota bacterium]